MHQHNKKKQRTAPWQLRPHAAAASDRVIACWVSCNAGRDSERLETGILDETATPMQPVSTARTAHAFIASHIITGSDGKAHLLWSEAPGFALRTLKLDPHGKPREQAQILHGDRRCAHIASCRKGNTLWVVWEAWDNMGRCRIFRSCSSEGGDWSVPSALTPSHEQAYWPSAAMLHDRKLAVTWCTPNAKRTGYDCMLTLANDVAGTIRTFRLNESLQGTFHCYPHLRRLTDGQIWLTWSATTEIDYYDMLGVPGNSRYTYLQDEASRARRSKWWNVSSPVVARVDGGDDAVALCFPPGHDGSGIIRSTGLLSRPTLAPGTGGVPLLVAQRYSRKTGTFHPAAFLNSPDGWRETALPGSETLSTRTPRQPCVLSMAAAERLVMIGTCEETAIQAFHTPEHSSRMSRCDITLNTGSPQKEACRGNNGDRQRYTCQDLTEKLYAPLPRKKPEFPNRNAQPESKPPLENKIYLGNIHVHTHLSVCRRETQQDPEFNMRLSRDLLGQDFVAITDHAEGLSASHWRHTRTVNEFHNFPGAFVALHAYEWTPRPAPDRRTPGPAHANVVFRDGGTPLVPAGKTACQGLEELWRKLPPGEAMTIPHHTATFPFQRDWDVHNPQFERLIEVFQDRRGNYEYENAPAAPGTGVPEQGRETRVPGCYAADALSRGYHLGFCSGGDHMGISMTGIAASTLDRDALFEALQKRHCYALTGGAIRLRVDVAINNRKRGKMGDVITAPPGAKAQIRVQICPASAPVRHVDLITLGKVVETRRTNGPDTATTVRVAFHVHVPTEETGEAYWYIRVTLADGNIAWSSPVWLRTRQTR